MKLSPDKNKPAPKETSRRADKVDIADALERLSDADWNRLKLRAEHLTQRGILKGFWRDVLHQAIVSTLDGKYPWIVDRNPTLAEHLYWTIRSVAYNERIKELIKDEQSGDLTTRVFNPELNDDDVFWDNLKDNSASVADEYEATEKIEAVFEYFKSDQLAVKVLKCRIADFTREEILKHLNLSPQEFETVRRRIKRQAVASSNLLAILK